MTAHQWAVCALVYGVVAVLVMSVRFGDNQSPEEQIAALLDTLFWPLALLRVVVKALAYFPIMYWLMMNEDEPEEGEPAPVVPMARVVNIAPVSGRFVVTLSDGRVASTNNGCSYRWEDTGLSLSEETRNEFCDLVRDVLSNEHTRGHITQLVKELRFD